MFQISGCEILNSEWYQIHQLVRKAVMLVAQATCSDDMSHGLHTSGVNIALLAIDVAWLACHEFLTFILEGQQFSPDRK